MRVFPKGICDAVGHEGFLCTNGSTAGILDGRQSSAVCNRLRWVESKAAQRRSLVAVYICKRSSLVTLLPPSC